ncbi:MAG: hypothetical protein JOZ38_03220 [Candidatus Eremiobacteraeota bacterium]|nr:hypothetical protein [Candidatus Eremiobacteraeota bacterium]
MDERNPRDLPTEPFMYEEDEAKGNRVAEEQEFGPSFMPRGEHFHDDE